MQDDTRERILEAAEALFAEHGFSRTSLRAITARAGVNLAAVNYHFGSKHALIQAIFTRRLEPINQERLARLEALRRQGRADLEAILEAFIAPTLKSEKDHHPGEVRFMRLLGRTHAGAADALRDFVHGLYAEVLAAFEQALVEALPELPRLELHWRLHFLMGVVSFTMAGTDTMRLFTDCHLPEAGDREALLRRLIPFLAAGLRAPLAPTERRPSLP
ncbi:MAG TPA: TetR/AcrR family transcriptional regulator [Candidatus Competibacteraceae bacterium]|nr:TetR/AcrR family transcriptional regulator [Candidatus Competibacteraceae bacterium]